MPALPATPRRRPIGSPIGSPARGLRLAAWLAALIGTASLPGAIVAEDSMASLSIESAATYAAQPLSSGTSAPPIVMLGLSVDEQLYGKAYDDSSDLDDDGRLDTGYSNALDYLGYFDPARCYGYADGRYKAAGAAAGEHGHQCLDALAGQWSGNFLNWLSTSRLDLLRGALYGGRRSVDSPTMTVLERSHVPADFHAWAKFYEAADAPLYTPFTQDPAAPGLSFCNVSFAAGGDADSASSTAPPLLRVARGSFRLWAAAETRECLWNEESASPDQPLRAATALGAGDYQVRVEVCDPAAPDERREAFCRQYPNGLKPAGQLQRYGEDGQLQFGLLSGSYAKPRSGGQLRRNAGPLVSNGDARCAVGDEIDLNSGQFCGGAAGIVGSIDRLRLARYRSTDSGAGHVDCPPGTINRGGSGQVLDNPGSGGNVCNSWGNPLAELYAEILRYLSGASAPTPAFGGDDSAYIAGLGSAGWRDAYAHTEHCAECSVLMVSTGAPSFDSDEIPAVPALAMTAAAATDAIGGNEALAGPTLLGRVGLTPLGNAPGTSGDHCSVKTLGPLSLARGICPEAPAREGSYLLAGLAHQAWIGDLRPDNVADPTSTGQQRARSYGLQFAGGRPGIPVPTAAGTLTITPACEASPLLAPSPGDGSWRSCSYGSMSFGAIRSASGQVYGRALAADGRGGSALIAWDDSSYGGGQSRRLLQLLSWCVGAACALDEQAPAGPDICRDSDSGALCTAAGQLARSIGDDELLVRVELLSAHDADSSLLGYTLSGASAGNGAQRLVLRQRGDDGDLLGNAAALGASARWSRPKLQAFTADAGPDLGPGRQLESPLFYAAKYGGYDYPAGSPAPLPSAGSGAVSCGETSWDHLDNASDERSPDCIPDNYYALANPARLRDRLGAVFASVLRRSGSGGSAPVLSGIASGPGAVYQSSYNLNRSDAAGRRVSWVGNLQALFVDRDGHLREDGNGNARLDETDYSATGDPVVELYYDAVERQSRFRRYRANPASEPTAFTVIDDPNTLRTIWNARRQLATVADAGSQRDYSAPASTGRYLFTFADFNLDGRAEAGEQLEFSSASIGAGRYGLLNVGSTAAADKLIRYTRGVELTAMRGRSVDDDGDGVPDVLRLGDIVNSLPLVVAAPAESYDLIYGDRTYAEFFNRYRGRRNVVYVGANDGLLHAFNAGFYEASTNSFRTTPADRDGISAHPLGSELWAYVPFNLLPQLGWLADPRYSHLWTMDGSPRAFDARVFAADATHPNGWGSLLVVGMRLGGGPVTIPAVDAGGRNRDAVSDFAAGLGSSASLGTRSAYVILDITDPEQPPVLIAEYSDRGGLLGYTTSAPTLAAFARRGATSAAPPPEDRWYLLFGSGPTTLTSASSKQNARLFGIDLKRLIANPAPVAQALIYGGPYDLGDLGGGPASGAPASFIGDPVAVDWDLNFRADALYFGSSSGSPAAPSGKLFKLDFNLTATVGGEGADPSGWRAPALLFDARRPLLAAPALTQDRGGRRWLLAGSGRLLAPGDKPSAAGQALFGLIDPTPGGAAPLFDSLIDTSAAVVATSGEVSGVTGVGSETGLIAAAVAAGGWRYSLATGAGQPAERSIDRSLLIDGLLLANSYTPSASLCSGDGSSRLFGFNFQTGAPRAQRPAFGSRRALVGRAEIDSAAGVLDLGLGLGSAPSLHVDHSDGSGPGSVTIKVQTTRGAVAEQDIKVSGGVRSGEIDWRQTHRQP